MLLKHFSRREEQTTFVAIGTLRVKQQQNLLQTSGSTLMANIMHITILSATFGKVKTSLFAAQTVFLLSHNDTICIFRVNLINMHYIKAVSCVIKLC